MTASGQYGGAEVRGCEGAIAVPKPRDASRGLAIPAVLVGLTTLGVLITASASGQSLAEVARREADRRAKMGESSKVYTNHDLKPAPSGSPSLTPTATGAASAATQPANGSETPEQASMKSGDIAPPPEHPDDRGEAFWHQRAEAIRTQLDAAKADAVALDARSETLNGAKGGAEARERDVVTAGQTRVRANVASIQSEWDRFEKTARDAKVPLAWIR